MSAFATYVSSDSEEDEEYEKRSAESNRIAKLEMERLKAKLSLEHKREELKKARMQREEESRIKKEALKTQEKEKLALSLASVLGLPDEERLLRVQYLSHGNSVAQGMSEVEERNIISTLVDAYIDDEKDVENNISRCGDSGTDEKGRISCCGGGSVENDNDCDVAICDIDVDIIEIEDSE